MSPLRDRVADQLRRIAAGSGDRLAVGRVQVAGEPDGWFEHIAYERGGLQRFTRTRSQADEGGAPIGEWQAAADDAQAQVLASALVQAQAWTADSGTELLPGMEIVNWTCVTADGVLDIVAPSASPLIQRFASVDLALRRIANRLEEQGAGAMLRVALQAKTAGDQVGVRVGLINDGHQRAVLVNPLLGEGGPAGYLRLELAPMPPEVPGETGFGAAFAPVPAALLPPGAEVAPWTDEYLVLDSAGRLLLPQAVAFTLPAPGRYLLRAVYANHGRLAQVAGVPVIRGRAFSNEVVVER